MSDERRIVQTTSDEYHLFPATLGRFVDVNVDFETDPTCVTIEVRIIEQTDDDLVGENTRAFDGDFVGVIRVPVSIIGGVQ